MNTHDREHDAIDETGASGGESDGDVTLPAGSDVVAQIRAQAARLRAEAMADSATVNQAADHSADTSADTETPDDVDSSSENTAISPSAFDEVDETVAGQLHVWTPEDSATHVPKQPVDTDPTVAGAAPGLVDSARSAATAPAIDARGSLIEGVEPPESSLSFWNDGTFRASGIDSSPRVPRAEAVPMWAVAGSVLLLIVALSLGISYLLVGAAFPAGWAS